MSIHVNCEVCNTEVIIYPSRFKSRHHFFCSKKCEGAFRIANNPNFLPCDICGKLHYIKPRDQKTQKAHCCSYQCMGILRKTTFLGEGNPNYGNRGLKHPRAKLRRISNYGYMLIKNPEHPFCDSGGWVKEHRIIAEQFLLNEINSVEIEGKLYLKRNFHVHHINGNKLDNSLANLQALTPQEHMRLGQKS